MKKQYVITFMCLFIVLSIALIAVQRMDPGYNFQVLEFGNSIMLALSITTYFVVARQTGKTPGAFIRGVMGATFMKLMVCMIAMLIYVFLNRSTIHKPSIFVLFGVYALYTTVETLLLTKLAKSAK